MLRIAWVRVILCSGPRQVINALTLYSVYKAKLNIEGNNFESSLSSFFDKIRALASEDYRQALILSGMLFTLVIWLFAFLSLLLAALFFVLFLWHYISADDGGLTEFCERKVKKRLKQIVSQKINKAMAEDERRRKKAELKAAKKKGEDRPMTMQPSLPTIPNLAGDDKLPEMPMLSRAETLMTLDGASRPSTPGSFELNSLSQKRPMPSRSATTATTSSQFSGRAPLINNAAGMGTSRPESPPSSLPTPSAFGGNYPPSRTATTSSNRSLTSNGPQLNRMPSNGSTLAGGYTASPATYSADAMPAFPAPVRSPTAPPGIGQRGPGPNQPNNWPMAGQNRSAFDEYPNGQASPAPSTTSYRSNALSPRGVGPDGYPLRSATNPMAPRMPGQRFPVRGMTAPMQGQHQHQQTASNSSLRNMVAPAQPYDQVRGHGNYDYPNRSMTANSQRNGPRGVYPYQQSQATEEYDYFNRPATANSQRNGPQGGYGSSGNDGWNQDVERGNGPRY